ncbi:MAG: AAA family ATPase [Patescibacteria group bacterium]|nr:AAA family ATPase [Patescibacteria group bacterium]
MIHALPMPPDGSSREGFPADARVFALRPSEKTPYTEHAHKDAVPLADYADVGGNLGIALDGQFLLVDFDAPHPDVATWAARLDAHPTWMQQARRGVHRLYTVPAGYRASNTKITAAAADGTQTVIGDLKVNGYVVGPGAVVAGHVYLRLNALDPAPAPPWLLEIVSAARPQQAPTGNESGRTRIEVGRNDDELAKIAGFLRRRGFEAPAIATMLGGVIGSGILEQDPTRPPYTTADAVRIARSADKWEVGAPLDLRIAADEWISGATVALTAAPVEWWVRGFVPKGTLMLTYGAGGIGKSSVMSWVAARISAVGGLFVHVGIEEPFRLFLARAVLLGGDRSRIWSIPNGSQLLFPRDVAALGRALEAAGAGCLYFDSIYSHFERQRDENAAERARRVLSSLAELANKTGCTVAGIFHENKGGELLGSTEMANVARIVLHATRGAGEGSPLRLAVRKTNLLDPGYSLEFAGHAVEWHDPATGEVQLEVNEHGTLEPLQLVLPAVTPERKSRHTVRAEDLDRANESRSYKAKQRAEEAKTLWAAGWKSKEIADHLGISQRSVQRFLGEKET